MTKKKKIIVSIISVIAVICVLAISVIVIYAASQHDFSSAIKVSFDAQGVDGAVSAKIYLGGSDTKGSSFTSDGTTSGKKVLTFKKDQFTSLILKPTQEFSLQKPNTFVVFEYEFDCSTIMQGGYTATMEFYGIADNIKVTTLNSASHTTNYGSITSTVSDPTNFTVSANIPQGRKYFVYIKAAIIDDSIDANFSANFSWKLKV